MEIIKKIILVWVAIFFTTIEAKAQKDFCVNPVMSFQGGERLSFRVYYNMGALWINAGNVVFSINNEIIDNHKVYHVIGDGKTAKSYDLFFKVDDRYQTYIDEETMLPYKFIRKVNEGGFKIDNTVVFDQKKKKAVSDTSVFTIPKNTQDVLSAIYFARNIDYSKYKPGDKIPFNMFLDNKVYPLYVKYIGKEKIKTKMGEYNAIKLVPLLIDGTIFKGGEKMVIWITDDNNHVPLRVSSPILVGSIKVDLLNYENLKHPFSSVIAKTSEKDGDTEY